MPGKYLIQFGFFPQMFADQEADLAETISDNLRIYLRYQREMYLAFKITHYPNPSLIYPGTLF